MKANVYQSLAIINQATEQIIENLEKLRDAELPTRTLPKFAFLLHKKTVLR